MENKVGMAKADSSKHFPWVFAGFFVGVCLLLFLATGCFGLFAWGLDSLQERAAANGTATQEVYSAHATGTYESLLPDRSTFGFIETFDDNINDWDIGSYDDQYFKGEVKISDGLYTWAIDQVKQRFSSYGSIRTTPLYMTDFDAFVDGIAHPSNSGGDYCYGMRFRSKWVVDSWAFYVYLVCDDGSYDIYYYDGAADSWLKLMTRQPTDAVHSGAWNTIGIMARGNHFKFLINDHVVHELDDDHVEAGLIDLLVEVNGLAPGSISFDNFAVQGR